MARPKNMKERNRIMACAQKLLLTQGYRHTSYQSIADACGQSRALVQHYLPRKDLILTSFLDRLQKYFGSAIHERRPETANDPTVYLALMCQLILTYLMDPRIRVVSLEILESRELTEMTVGSTIDFLFTHFDLTQEAEDVVSDTITWVSGGVFELVYAKLRVNETIDPLNETYRVLDSYAEPFGMDKVVLLNAAREAAFSPEECQAILDGLMRSLDI